MAEIDKFLQYMEQNDVSDMHLTADMKPLMRVHGSLLPLGEKAYTNEVLERILFEILNEEQMKKFEDTSDLDFAYELEGVSRFRVNYFMQQRGIGSVFRAIPAKILSVEELGIPDTILKFAELSMGLVLVTGPTGSGKSTTLAAIISYINEMRSDHILTIEDPVEFVHTSKKCLVNHRQVGTHTKSFSLALRAALREDPDVILIGELRDLETMELAITAAETGHLVFATLHTSSAPKTIDRIIDAFPADQQSQIRVMLSESLKGVICQQLLKRSDKPGRIAALEILVVTQAISNLIREGKIFQIPSAMQTGKQFGMQLMDEAILEFYDQKIIDADEAYLKAFDKTIFEALLKKSA